MIHSSTNSYLSSVLFKIYKKKRKKVKIKKGATRLGNTITPNFLKCDVFI